MRVSCQHGRTSCDKASSVKGNGQATSFPVAVLSLARVALVRIGIMTMAAGLCADGLRGQESTWTAPAGNWSDGNCWSGGVPSSIPWTWATVANGGTATITQPGGTCGFLHVGPGAVHLTSGSLASSTVDIGGHGGYVDYGRFVQNGGVLRLDDGAGFLSVGNGGYELHDGNLVNLNGGTSAMAGRGPSCRPGEPASGLT